MLGVLVRVVRTKMSTKQNDERLKQNVSGRCLVIPMDKWIIIFYFYFLPNSSNSSLT